MGRVRLDGGGGGWHGARSIDRLAFFLSVVLACALAFTEERGDFFRVVRGGGTVSTWSCRMCFYFSQVRSQPHAYAHAYCCASCFVDERLQQVAMVAWPQNRL